MLPSGFQILLRQRLVQEVLLPHREGWSYDTSEPRNPAKAVSQSWEFAERSEPDCH
jgi:hypothetical protein